MIWEKTPIYELLGTIIRFITNNESMENEDASNKQVRSFGL